MPYILTIGCHQDGSGQTQTCYFWGIKHAVHMCSDLLRLEQAASTLQRLATDKQHQKDNVMAAGAVPPLAALF